ncbi:MAG: hypothetical protein ABWZ40_10845 [Caulobacterales bacterium]
MSVLNRLLNLNSGKDQPSIPGVRSTSAAAALPPRYPAGDGSLAVSDAQIAKALAAKKTRNPAASTPAETRALVGVTGARSTFGLRQSAALQKR